MRVDAHQHFWRYSAAEYDWIDDNMRAIRADFYPETLAPFLTASGIDGTIAVQARQSLIESNWLLELAQKHELIKGVVGWVPLADSGVAGMLDILARNSLFKGVRHVVQGESDPVFLEGRAFNEGIRAVTKLGLAYDLLVVARQLPAAIKFVDLHPEQAFVLDHIAKPAIQGPPPAEWCRNIKLLAQRGNVSCKFSGVVTEVPGWQWTPELLRPYFEVVLEAFGPRRLMFGSDWPVCLVAASYAKWFEFLQSCTASLSPGERSRILGGTAIEIYRL
jgi:L-fuconolactonase